MQKVTSREYKVMLNPKKFKGDEKELLAAAQKFWDSFSKVIKGIVATEGALSKLEQRQVRFYDTKDQLLYSKHGYVFRERIEKEEREVTLKFRHRDRYLSQDRNMRDKDGNDKGMKFEEDIKPPVFVSLYSFSNTTTIKAGKKLNRLDDPARLFPDLEQQLGKAYEPQRKISIVNGFTAFECVIKGASFLLDGEQECTCALIVWYDKEFTGKPVAAEFSFKYKNDQEQFSGLGALQAYKVFQLLQEAEQLAPWLDLAGPTKTGFAYSYAA